MKNNEALAIVAIRMVQDLRRFFNCLISVLWLVLISVGCKVIDLARQQAVVQCLAVCIDPAWHEVIDLGGSIVSVQIGLSVHRIYLRDAERVEDIAILLVIQEVGDPVLCIQRCFHCVIVSRGINIISFKTLWSLFICLTTFCNCL